MKASLFLFLLLAVGIMTNVYATSETYQFIGFSTETVQGGVGIVKMAEACQSSFRNKRKKVRLCNSKEVLQTPNLELQPGITGWLHPIIVAARASDINVTADFYDYSGINIGNDGASCRGWSNATNNFTGMILIGNQMRFSNAGCDIFYHVTCCAPQ